MNITRRASFALSALLLVAGLAWLAPAAAQPVSPAHAAAPAAAADAYTKEGADTCLGCHDDETPGYSGSALFKTRHAARTDKRAPFGPGGLQCEACHGPGATHAKNKKATSINTFKADSRTPLAERNQVCLGCHSGTQRSAWHAGAHERNNLACTDCHKVHKDHDPVLKTVTESDVCFSCHKRQRGDFHKLSAHPVKQGLMSCSSCHAAHGSAATAMLNKPTTSQTCASCHADKRGPMLWEHAPVAEDCGLCHSPHGSVRPALLTKNPPLLCQQCHSPAGHPSVPRTAGSLPGGGSGGASFLLGGSCTNCHTQVHGSNHPAGAKLMR